MKQTNKLTRCLQTVVMTLCCFVVLNACSDDTADNSAQQERKALELKTLLAGSWNMDTDGMSNFDLALTEYYFDDQQLAMTYYTYDYLLDGYSLEVLSYDYTVLGCSEDNGREVFQLRITPTQQTKDWVTRKNEETIAGAEETRQEDYALYDIEDFTDTLQLVVKDNNSIGFLIPKEDIAYYESQGLKLTDDALYFQRGGVDVSSLDSKSVRESIEEVKKELEEYQALYDGDPTSLNMPKLKAQVRRASETQHLYDNKGHELRQWMKSVPDDRMLCKMMIPGAHDSGTYGMYWDWLRTLAKTQDQDIKGQWDHGIRCFDLRVRNWNGENRLYHDLISCDVTMKDVFQQMQDKLRENPQDGAIIMVKVEGNNASQWLTIVQNLSNYIPLGITRGLADNVTTTKETVKLVEEYFLNQTVDGHPMLAKFHPDMTMKDLRGRVVVMLQDAPSESEVNYGKLKDYLAVDLGDKYGNMVGNTRPLKSQNDWEQRGGGDESTYGYLQRKTTKFRNLLFETVANAADSYWVYNAANGYYRDFTSVTDAIPDYATYAQEAYPIFTRDIIRYGNPRGIVLLDYVGWDHFKRVKLATLAGWGIHTAVIGIVGVVMITAMTGFTGGVGIGILATTLGLAFGTGAVQTIFGTHWTTPTFYLFWLVYQALKADADFKNPKTQDLVKAIVEVNFPEQYSIGVSDNPVDVGR